VTSPDAGIEAQIRNIEATYGKPLHEWFTVIRASGLTKHAEVVAMLKQRHGMKHGAAHRIALVARDTQSPHSPEQHLAELYSGKQAHLRPIHDRLIAVVNELGGAEVAPRKGYISLRRGIQPATKFNALFTHRVRITELDEIDHELRRRLKDAYNHAGDA
jgi:hypothetical protein